MDRPQILLRVHVGLLHALRSTGFIAMQKQVSVLKLPSQTCAVSETVLLKTPRNVSVDLNFARIVLV